MGRVDFVAQYCTDWLHVIPDCHELGRLAVGPQRPFPCFRSVTWKKVSISSFNVQFTSCHSKLLSLSGPRLPRFLISHGRREKVGVRSHFRITPNS